MFRLRISQVVRFYWQNVIEKRLWKSGILSKDASQRPASLPKMPLFQRRFSNILSVKINYLVST